MTARHLSTWELEQRAARQQAAEQAQIAARLRAVPWSLSQAARESIKRGRRTFTVRPGGREFVYQTADSLRGFNAALRPVESVIERVRQDRGALDRAVYAARAETIAKRDRLHAASSDAAVKAWARRRAAECGAAMMRGAGLMERYALAREYVGRWSVDAPPPPADDAPLDDYRPILARLGHRRWWTFAARRMLGRQIEREERAAGRVHKRAGLYISDAGLDYWKAGQRRNRQLLLGLVATNEAGESFCVADLAETSTANPHIKHCELMTRIRGCERLADRYGFVGLFVTWTLASRYHRNLSKSCALNPEWDGSEPRDGQMRLRKLWELARASLAKLRAQYFGVRVAEPHHDGTPHWHMLLFVQPSQADTVCDLMRRYALVDDPTELGADQHRFKVERISAEKGGATAYVAKYVSKHTTGVGLGGETKTRHADGTTETVGTPHASAVRARAWASNHGIRQFQFVGLPAIGIWRELRRVRDPIQQGPHMTAQTWAAIEGARAAADAGDYALHVRMLGGPCIARDAVACRVWTVPGDVCGFYGDDPAPRIEGVARFIECQGQALRVWEHTTRLHTWTVSPRAELGADRAECALGPVSLTVTADAGLAGGNSQPEAETWQEHPQNPPPPPPMTGN